MFDSNEFYRLSTASFVASVKFFFDTVNDFKQVELILGIEDGDFVLFFEENLFQILNVKRRVELFQSLSEKRVKRW